jgi:hypothetical protein
MTGRGGPGREGVLPKSGCAGSCAFDDPGPPDGDSGDLLARVRRALESGRVILARPG